MGIYYGAVIMRYRIIREDEQVLGEYDTPAETLQHLPTSGEYRIQTLRLCSSTMDGYGSTRTWEAWVNESVEALESRTT
jgi:hypothetical protein